MGCLQASELRVALEASELALRQEQDGRRRDARAAAEELAEAVAAARGQAAQASAVNAPGVLRV